MVGALILIIEDDERSRRLVRDVLQHDGFATIEAATAADGVAQAELERPALIIMDIQLPDMDGVTALGQLRSNPATASIPIVAVTAFAMASERERFLAAGFTGYFAKPIDIATLRQEARRLAPGSSASSEPRV
jgi:two-component system cell cycle response regulator DivK